MAVVRPIDTVLDDTHMLVQEVGWVFVLNVDFSAAFVDHSQPVGQRDVLQGAAQPFNSRRFMAVEKIFVFDNDCKGSDFPCLIRGPLLADCGRSKRLSVCDCCLHSNSRVC